jgi:putative thiamine transport system ATP-binding protein
MSPGAFAVEHVNLAVSGRTLVSGLSFTVSPGCATTIMGASGAGKSALIGFIGGHLDAAFTASGRVIIEGRDVSRLPAEQRAVGVLFQDDLLFPHLSVGANLAFGLDPAIRGRGARRARVEQALAEAGLVGFYGRDPATLSGGQRARAALMRSLLAVPRVLLLDEPFGKLDQTLRRDFRRFVLDSAARRALPVLMATHDPADAEAAGGPVLRIGDEFAPDRPSKEPE